MPSPFPGMDPWLEDPAIFPDLHNSLIIRLGDAINPLLPPPYFATSGSRVWIDQSFRFVEPDLDVLYPPAAPKAPIGKKKLTGHAVAASEPLRLHVPHIIDNDESTEWFLEIHASPDH